MKSASTTPSPRGSRLRMKRKRLDAICESVFSQNHVDRNRGDGDGNSEGGTEEVRRSSRVRRPPAVLDLSPPPAKKRRKSGALGKGKAKVKEEGESGDSDGLNVDLEGSWKSRLRSRSRSRDFRGGGKVVKKGRRRNKKRSFDFVAEEEEENLVVVSPGKVKTWSGNESEENRSNGDDEDEDEASVGEEENAWLDEDVVFVDEGGSEGDEPTLTVGEMVRGSRGGKAVKKGWRTKKKRKGIDCVVEVEGNLEVMTLGKVNALGGLGAGGSRSGRDDDEEASGGRGDDGDRVRVVGEKSATDNAVFVDEGGSEGDDLTLADSEMVRGLKDSKVVKKIDSVVEEVEGNLELVRLGEVKALSGLVDEGNWSSKDGEDEARGGKGENGGLDEDGNGNKMKVVKGGAADDAEFVGEGEGNKLKLAVGEMVSEVAGGTREEGGSVGLGSGMMVGRDEMVENEECGDVEVDESVNDLDRESDKDAVLSVQVDANLVEEVKDGAVNNEEEFPCNEILVEDGKELDENKLKCSADVLSMPQIKQGRKCGLCGCGNDGRPPKRLEQDAGDSDKELYGGSSASEEPNYDIWDGFGDEPEWLGRLLGPINDRFGIAGIWVHQHCAVWSPEVYFAGLGRLKSVRAALCRGRALKCTRCGRPGATIGCRVDRCNKTYHLPCARASRCIFDHLKFLIACTDHKHLFQRHGHQSHRWLEKLKAKKMKIEIRKQSNDAWRKDVEAEEKWLENCGEDEEFLKRESKRLQRDLLRIAPVYIGGSSAESGQLFDGWESVAGLQDVIQCLKEVVILPLLYPEFFSNLGIKPPRGVLLHGHPGTGKTLVVRALIGSCARGDKRIAYFARKGADCLGKYVGDAERQLRLLFQVAEKCQPSIIFFDEVDGLAPCRTRQQDQTHNSVVSTLLALMDGLKSRGSVVVIGATNRPEAVDSALRRPGRFDREIYFPLPSVKDRAAILSLHTQRWLRPVDGSLLDWIARKTIGFAGADLQALCTQAAMIALKRNFPLHEVLSAAGQMNPGNKLPPLPKFAVEERDWLEALACASPPCSRRVDGIAVHDLVSNPLPTHLTSSFLRPLLTLLVSLYLDERLLLPNSFLRAARSVESVVISSLEKKNMPSEMWWSHINHLLEEADVVKALQRKLSNSGILGGDISDSFADDAKDDFVDLEASTVSCRPVRSHVIRSTSLSSGMKSGFRVLIAGSPRSGQRHLASGILQCFVGNTEIRKVDLATFSHEGHGDMVLGITQLLLKCSSSSSCFIFMPRVDLWAVEITNDSDNASPDASHFPNDDGETIHLCKPPETVNQQAATQIVSHLWNLFVEQLESICVSTSLTIMATSDIPFQGLPEEIRQFFNFDISNHSSINCQRTMPRFCVDLDEGFNHEAILSLSARELSSNLTRFYIQFLHQRTHTIARPNQDTNISTSSEDCSKHTNDKATVQLPHDSVVGASAPPNIRSLRGKPSFLLAMSTFGYQILLYPHFAELCWVTSKLKEGPCADISRSWKGWPFNSCIIRPCNPLDKVFGTSVSGITRNKEICGVVRGLVAVGLLAYRGEYKSLREVSFEVRKVLQLLVGQISERMQSGNERHRYVRLLSQVAYLEDMVNNWTFTLQSLDADVQSKREDPKQVTIKLQESVSGVNPLEGKKCEGNGSHLSSKCLEAQMKHATVNFGLEPDEGNPLCHSGCNAALAEDEAPHQIIPSDGSILGKCDRNTGANDLFAGENGTTLGQCDPENTAILDGKSEFSKPSDGFVSRELVSLSHDGLGNSGVSHALGSSARNLFDQIKESDRVEHEMRSAHDKPVTSGNSEKTNGSPAVSAAFSAESPPTTCSFRCCSICLAVLRSTLEKIFAANLGSDGICSVEDVHDAVESLSVELLSAIRKVDHGRSINIAIKDGNTGWGGCDCRGPDSSFLAARDCGCHSIDECATAQTNNSTDQQIGADTNFVFRNGVLFPVNSNKDIDFHCTYETLCLCPLVKLMLEVKPLGEFQGFTRASGVR